MSEEKRDAQQEGSLREALARSLDSWIGGLEASRENYKNAWVPCPEVKGLDRLKYRIPRSTVQIIRGEWLVGAKVAGFLRDRLQPKTITPTK